MSLSGRISFLVFLFLIAPSFFIYGVCATVFLNTESSFQSSSKQIHKSQRRSHKSVRARNVNAHKRKWRGYQSAKIYIQSQGIKTKREFQIWVRSGKKPANIPSNPDRFYKFQWEGWGEFLGTGRVSTQKMEWRDYQSAKIYV